ncbi:MAG: PspA/IM30 family protein [Peptococcaceae bacterium]|jgi:phage shock protein A|nr:PspA/IM30 family protein [Peptococcaceae bacterium]
MAGILERFGDIMSANINALLSKAEGKNRVKLAEQYVIKAKSDFAEVKQALATVLTAEKKAQAAYEKELKDTIGLQEAAEHAVQAGDDAGALKILERLEREQAEVDAAKTAWDAARVTADKARKMHNKLAADIRVLESQKNQIVVNDAVAKAQETTNKMASGSLSADVTSKMAQLNQSAADALLNAESVAELNEEPRDETDDLVAKYTTNSAAAQDKLAELKAKLGK